MKKDVLAGIVSRTLSVTHCVGKALELSRNGQADNARRSLQRALPTTARERMVVEVAFGHTFTREGRREEAQERYKGAFVAARRYGMQEKEMSFAIVSLFFALEPLQGAKFAIQLGLESSIEKLFWEELVVLCHKQGQWEREAAFWKELASLPLLLREERAQALYHQGVAAANLVDTSQVKECFSKARKGFSLKGVPYELSLAGILVDYFDDIPPERFSLALKNKETLVELVRFLIAKQTMKKGLRLCEKMISLLQALPDDKQKECGGIFKLLKYEQSRLEVWQKFLPKISKKYLGKRMPQSSTYAQWMSLLVEKENEVIELFRMTQRGAFKEEEFETFLSWQRERGVFITLHLISFLELLEVIQEIYREQGKEWNCRIKFDREQEEFFTIKRRILTFWGGSRILFQERREEFKTGIAEYLKKHKL